MRILVVVCSYLDLEGFADDFDAGDSKKITLIPADLRQAGPNAEAENQALGIALSMIGAQTPKTLDEVDHVFLHRARKVEALAAQMYSLLMKGVDFFSFGNGEPVVPFFSHGRSISILFDAVLRRLTACLFTLFNLLGFSFIPTFEALKRIVPFDDFMLHIKKFPTIKIHIHPATALMLKRFGELVHSSPSDDLSADPCFWVFD